MPKLKTEREAWLYAAKLWDGAELDEYGLYNVLGKFGICPVVRNILGIEKKIMEQMFDRIHTHMDRLHIQHGMHLFPCTKSGASKRAALCRKFAKECAKEDRK